MNRHHAITLPKPRRRPDQGTLFDVDPLLTSTGAARSWVGDFFEEATAVLTGATRLRTDGRLPWCPDLQFSARHFLESKAVGQSGQMIVYEGRANKDADNLRRRRARLTYVIWRHRFRTTTATSHGELRRGLAEGVEYVLLIDFAELHAILRKIPPRKVNTVYTIAGRRNGYGSESKGYGIGWTISLRSLIPGAWRPESSLFRLEVYGVILPCVPIISRTKVPRGFLP